MRVIIAILVVFLHVYHAPCQAEPGDSLLPASFRDVAVTPTSFSSTASECYDRSTRCEAMADVLSTICTTYVGWSRYYCAKFCNECDHMASAPPGPLETTSSATSDSGQVSESVTPSTTSHATTPATDFTTSTTEEPCCVDQLGWQECISHKLESCQEPYYAWASVRCQAFCGMCRPCPLEPCEDVLPNCEEYGEQSCVLESYRIWATLNCRKHCGLCVDYGFYYKLNNISVPTGSESPSTTATPTTAESETSTSGSGSGTAVGSTTEAGSVCQDAVTHCAEYGRGACTHYSNFMSDYCAKFCGFCTDSGSTEATQVGAQSQTSLETTTGESLTSTLVPPNCGDVLSNCTNYPLENCCGIYESWARSHCASYCGFCGTPPPRVCEDKVDYCSREPGDLCTNTAYTLWRLQNCAGFCKVCDEPWTPPYCAQYLYKEFTNATQGPTQGVSDTTQQPTQGFTDTTQQPTQGVSDITQQPTQGFTDTTQQPTQGVSDTTQQPTQGFTDTTQQPTQGVTDTTQQPTQPTQQPTEELGVSTGSLCKDMLDNCTSLHLDNCCGIYEFWARASCARYCGFCGVVPDRLCHDTIDDCDRQSHDLCTNDTYAIYRQSHCAGFCKLCDQPWKPPSCTAHFFPTSQLLVG